MTRRTGPRKTPPKVICSFLPPCKCIGYSSALYFRHSLREWDNHFLGGGARGIGIHPQTPLVIHALWVIVPTSLKYTKHLFVPSPLWPPLPPKERPVCPLSPHTWTEVTWPWWPLRTATGAVLCEHQTLTDLSRLPEAIIVLSQLRDMSVTSAQWPRKVASSWPVRLDHTFTRLSSAPCVCVYVYVCVCVCVSVCMCVCVCVNVCMHICIMCGVHGVVCVYTCKKASIQRTTGAVT